MIFSAGEEPVIDVGLMVSGEVEICFNGQFLLNDEHVSGCVLLFAENGHIVLNKSSLKSDKLVFVPRENSTFTVKNVVFGIGFHWERTEDMTYTGHLIVQVENHKLNLINRVALEDYLKSVIASEMSASASTALLKAHAVMSRSWLLAQLLPKNKKQHPFIDKPDEVYHWYDREDHYGFDVCADDHCQRYQGITRVTNEKAVLAVNETRGEVLTYEGEVCDARFSKCCGGISERFDTCWEDANPGYLQPVFDGKQNTVPDVQNNKSAEKWISSCPDVYCNTADELVLKQVLNDYDRETKSFFRWTEVLTGKEISAYLKSKYNRDLGEVKDIIPVKRGPSSRIYQLKLVGSKGTLKLGKELDIRKALSPTHLLSSAFKVYKKVDANGDTIFTLEGAGWGHGAGLCQIGAAVMGQKGFHYQEILQHYFKNTYLETIY